MNTTHNRVDNSIVKISLNSTDKLWIFIDSDRLIESKRTNVVTLKQIRFSKKRLFAPTLGLPHNKTILL